MIIEFIWSVTSPNSALRELVEGEAVGGGVGGDVAVHLDAVVVARHRPEPDPLVVVHGRLVAEPPVHVVGVLEELLAERIELHRKGPHGSSEPTREPKRSSPDGEGGPPLRTGERDWSRRRPRPRCVALPSTAPRSSSTAREHSRSAGPICCCTTSNDVPPSRIVLQDLVDLVDHDGREPEWDEPVSAIRSAGDTRPSHEPATACAARHRTACRRPAPVSSPTSGTGRRPDQPFGHSPLAQRPPERQRQVLLDREGPRDERP